MACAAACNIVTRKRFRKCGVLAKVSLPKILCSPWGMPFPQPDCEGQAFCPLLESGGGDSPTQASAREHSSNTKANDPRRESPWRGGVGLFRQPVARSGGAVHRPAALPRRTPFAAAESLVAPVSPSLTKDAFAIGDSNRNTN